MLVLSRKCNEQIVIGDQIIVTVVSIKGGTVRLGIEAPPHVSVHREEVLRAIRQDLGKTGQPETENKGGTPSL